MASRDVQYPFSAIVGQNALKQALILSAIDPSLGGVLALGDRGTGKTTAVRALAALLPPIEAVKDCRYNRAPEAGDETHTIPVPVVDLPLGATEDRVLGALDIEKALVSGEKAYEPGLLADANRGYLYIDEVNLLEDHLVDVLLDVAASGWNVVERDGLSVRHPARFVLVGSGNPEEGELRPQLLDRFGLSVDVATPTDVQQRVDIIRRRESFEQDRAAFSAVWQKQDETTRLAIEAARGKLDAMLVSDAMVALIAEICIALGTDGLRGELTLMKAARAMAAWEGRDAVMADDVRAMAPLALAHRLRRNPLDDARSTVRVERALDEIFPAQDAA